MSLGRDVERNGSAVAALAPRRMGFAPGWEAFLVFLVALVVSLVNDKLCLVVLAGLTCWLVHRHEDSPADVMGIVFAVFCEAPLLRRVHDLFHGFTPSSSILIASYIAFPFLGYKLLRNLPSYKKLDFVPMVLSATGVIWGYCVGSVKVGILPASIQLLQYSVGPIVFAYLLVKSTRFDTKVFFRWLLSLGAIESIYGVYQWVAPPPWDVAWFNGVGMAVAGGVAAPFMMRPFGTLNSTSPFAYFLFFVLVVGLGKRAYFAVGPLMIAALATTQGRSTWGATAIGWVVSIGFAKFQDKGKLTFSIVGTLLIVMLCATPFADRLSSMVDRLNSVKNLKGDNSFRNRSSLLNAALEGGAFDDPIGVGLGSSGSAARVSGSGLSTIDNGFLQTVWMFGWVGSFFYLGGLFWGMGRGLMNIRTLSLDRIQFVAAAMALFVANIFESSLDDLKGVMIWGSLGIVALGTTTASKSPKPDGSGSKNAEVVQS